MKFRVPIFKEGKLDKFDYHEISVTKGSNSYAFGNCQFIGDYEIKEPEFSPMFEDESGKPIYVNDIVQVCVFRVSPQNPDDDHHYKCQIIFENGMYQANIFGYMSNNTNGVFIPITDKKSPFYNDDELLEDGTITIPFFILVAQSGNLGTYQGDNVKIIGNIYQTPELL